ncbi:MAG: sigma-70 family RNA polymerase sigma factor [Deltaproteobacteria bacterium]|nr:sigma-70 family RNA polymerase sigma factor [Deltaproteobacteria bacterium]
MENTGPVELKDDQLVGLAKSGDRKAFEMIVERYKQKAYQVAFHHLRDREEAKDISQEAFLRAYTQLKRFDSRSSFYTWFYRILVNLCIDHQRKHRRLVQQDFGEKEGLDGQTTLTGDHPTSPDQQLSAEQMSRKMAATLESLTPNQRTAFLLKNHEGLSIQEIARIMKSAEGTIKVHLHRAVTALRKNLAEFV